MTTYIKKITTMAKDLVATGEEIGKEFGVPIVNKRISVTIAFDWRLCVQDTG